MDISVVCVTCRYGGIDVLLYSMAQQDFDVVVGVADDEYELILVDELYDQRKEPVKDLADKLDVNLIHIPHSDHSSIFRCASNTNDGLRVVKGELLVLLDDYTWMESDALRKHWEQYKYDGRTSIGMIHNVAPLPMDPLQKEYGPGLITVFKKRCTTEPGPFTKKDDREPYNGLSQGMGMWFYNNNSSVPMSVVKKLNGFDEGYGKAPGVLDIDFGQRAELAGHKFIIRSDIRARHFDHRKMFDEEWYREHKKNTKNLEYMQKRIVDIKAGKQSVRSPNNRFDLEESDG